ncbi:MAG: MBL fold metallo-hydrolase [Candidatus Zambryskibacteria bacterium]|nr:MBL fold metallo-hydrolase [Candidatus Zambryskibacteria bacterium]
MGWVKKYSKEVVVGLLFLSNIFVWVAVYARQSGNLLSVYFLDIGQGDSILIDSPQHGRALVDGGRNRKVLAEIDKVLPFGDKRIDVVIATHPDADHIGGLPEVVSRYKVGLFMEPGVESDNTVDDELEKRVEEKNIPTLLARRGIVINFGDEAKLQILFPNQDVSNWETNRASVVSKLTYGSISFLLTADSPMAIEDVLMNLDRKALDADVLKAGHHGSRTSTAAAFAAAVSPQYAVISAGKNNSYGHPHKEVLDILKSVGAQIVSTIDMGTIKFQTDGKILEIK